MSRRCIECGSKEGKFEVRENTLRFSSGITLGTIQHWSYPLKSKDGNENETYLALFDLKNSMISAFSPFWKGKYSSKMINEISMLKLITKVDYLN